MKSRFNLDDNKTTRNTWRSNNQLVYIYDNKKYYPQMVLYKSFGKLSEQML